MSASPTPIAPPGALDGVKVVELASEHGAWAGKLLADLGADVIVVEPPGGHPSRAYGPFVDDEPGPERSLWWWNYNTSKRSVVLDLAPRRRGARSATSPPTPTSCSRASRRERWPSSGSTTTRPAADHPELIWVSVTPFGRATSRAHEPATDLTLLGGGGPVWNCGYDDHTIPPVRGGGNQAFHIGSVFAAMSALTAVLAPRRVGTRPVHRREHARGGERHHRERQLRLARGEEHGDPPDRAARARVDHPGDPGRVCRRTLREHRLPAASREGLREPARLGRRARVPRRVRRDRAPRPRGRTRRDLARRAPGGSAHRRDLRRRAQRAGLPRRAPHAGGVLRRRAGAGTRGAARSGHRKRRSTTSTSSPAASPSTSSTRTSGARSPTPAHPSSRPKSPWRISRRPPHIGEHQDEVFGKA